VFPGIIRGKSLMEINTTLKEKYALIEPLEEIGLYNSMEFKKLLNDIIENTQLNIVMDLSNIRYADSSLIASLLFALRKMTTLKREFALVNVEDEIINIMRLANIEKNFKIYRNESELL
jgi:anti-anti-sigma factor